MYTKFKDCLLNPSKIAKYVFDNAKKTILYFIVLLFLHVLPLTVNTLSEKEMPFGFTNIIVEKFQNAEKINYQLVYENSQTSLKSLKENQNSQFIDMGIINAYQTKLLLIFDMNDDYHLENLDFDQSLFNQTVVIIHFSQNHLSISLDLIKNNLNRMVLFNESYENLGLKSLDFSIANQNIAMFKNEVNNAYQDFYQKNVLIIYLIFIPLLIILGIISLLLEILLISFIYKLLYRNLNLQFRIFFKLILCCYTPCVVFNLLSIFYGSAIMYFIGEILVVIYASIALRNVVIARIGNEMEKIIKNQGDK